MTEVSGIDQTVPHICRPNNFSVPNNELWRKPVNLSLKKAIETSSSRTGYHIFNGHKQN